MAGDRDCDLKSRGLGTNNLTAHKDGGEKRKRKGDKSAGEL